MAYTIFYFSVSILAATAFLLTSSTVAQINTALCESAPDKDLCTKLVKDATDWPTAMTNAISGGLVMAKSGKPDSLISNLPTNREPSRIEEVGSLCYRYYDSMVYHIEESLDLMKDPDSTASFSIPTYLCTNLMRLCMETLEESNLTLPDVTNFNSEMSNLYNVLCHLARLKKEWIIDSVERQKIQEIQERGQNSVEWQQIQERREKMINI